jgi:sugar-specific transcriptional regulator TrmB/DNA-binding CsgD family transcriptional regulator
VLEPLGVNEFDERVYRALLGQEDSRPADLARSLGVSAPRLRQAVRRLCDLGLARRVAPGVVRPVGPRLVLGALLNEQRLAAETAFSRLQLAVEDLAQEYQSGMMRTDPGSLVQVFSGRDEINRMLGEMARSTGTHLWTLDKPPYLEWPSGQDPNEIEYALTRSLLDRGVEIRAVYCPAGLDLPGRFDTVVRLTELGEQARLLQNLPLKLRIQDRRIAIVPLVGGVYDSLAVVHPSGLLDALMELFEAYWERAVPLVADPPDTDDGPPQEDLEILRMLRIGLKDQAVARQLGVSERTATRRISGIMTRLGATSRFQAGVEAALRGWL